jgi:hypothetical protein
MSPAKLAANRANARHSTGPADTSRSRLNGLQHGLTSSQTVITGESQADYDEFRTGFLTDLNPQCEIEQLLADRVVTAAWRLKRFHRVENAFFTNRIDEFLNSNPESDPDVAMANLFIDPAEVAKMRLFLRYQKAVEREYDKAMAEFRKACQEREKRMFDEAVGFASSPVAAPMPAPSEYMVSEPSSDFFALPARLRVETESTVSVCSS